MDIEHLVLLIAGGTFLVLTLVAARHAARSPLAIPFGVLCASLFAYAMLETLGHLLQQEGQRVPPWDWLEAAAAAFTAPALAHFTVVFVGGGRRATRALGVVYAYFGLLAATCLWPLVDASWGGYPGGPTWARAMLAGYLPTFAFSVALLGMHLRRGDEQDERSRTWLLAMAVVIGVLGASSDLVRIADLAPAPQISGGAILIAALLAAAVTFRFRLLQNPTALFALNAAVLAVVTVVAHVVVLDALGQRPALLLLGSLTVTVLAIGAARAMYGSFAAAQARTAYLATLGRLSAQMAHDIRNPLAALKGAAQYLEEEGRRGAFPEDALPFVEMLVTETDRLAAVVDRYQRIGRTALATTPVVVAELIERRDKATRLAHPAVANGEVTLASTVAPELGGATLVFDGDLVEVALENLLRNALEAGGRTLTLTAERRGDTLRLRVGDDGRGMDARTRAQIRRPFFTTKADGTGLGLAFARRVAVAHGGRLRVDSALGRGTEVTLELPAMEAG